MLWLWLMTDSTAAKWLISRLFICSAVKSRIFCSAPALGSPRGPETQPHAFNQ